jgi:CRISPR-associated protein Cmr6
MSEFMKELDRKRGARDREREESKLPRAHTGNIIFHDAWPETWPQLIVDIVNNHHSQYYQADPNDNAHPPGDWEDPVPVYFLAVKPGVTFTFPLAKRRADVPEELLELARQWLLGALCHLGAGAKTNTGYGAFKSAEGDAPTADLEAATKRTWEAAKARNKRAEFTCTLELVTPAFLAGANQQAEDCDLRPATLRGLLRWWWRTMHAGFLDVKTLRALEAAIWGDTKTGGAVRIELRPQGTAKSIPVPGKQIQKVQKDNKGRDVLRVDPEFCKAQDLERPPDKKATQGLLYLMFGMDEMPAGKPNERKRRQCLLPGAKWDLVLTARDGFYRQPDSQSNKEVCISAATCLEQARAALWLLCEYGGVGSKNRHGFGSLSLTESLTLSDVKRFASNLRKLLGLPNNAGPVSESSSLEHLLTTDWIRTPWKNYWFVLDQLGFSIQAFCQADGRKRTWIKEALGLPRKIGKSSDDGSRDRGYTPTVDKKTKEEVIWLGQMHPHRGERDAKDMRHASPVHCHLRREADGTYSIQVVAFPCSVLPDTSTSSKVLNDLMQHIKNDLADRIRRYATRSQSPASSWGQETASPRQPSSLASTPPLPRPRERVEAVLLEEKTKKGGWKAKHLATNISGPIQNSNDVPKDKKPGDKLTLIVMSANEREIAFRWPTAADEHPRKN